MPEIFLSRILVSKQALRVSSIGFFLQPFEIPFFPPKIYLNYPGLTRFLSSFDKLRGAG